MGNVEMVVFDMAGTTVKDAKEVETCFAQACTKTGLEVSEERILALQGYSKIEVFRMLWDEKIGKEHPEYAENVFVSYDAFTDILENHYQKNPIYPTDYCLETFELLRSKNIKIALTTGFYRKVCDIILDKLGWLNGLDSNYCNTSGNGIIDLSIASNEVEKGRPEPFMILKAMKTFNITDSQKIINIGDTPSDLISGKKAMAKFSLGLCNGTHTSEQLSIVENDGLLANLSELKKYLS